MFDPVIAPSHTLLGLLQRGRGDGTLHALAADRGEALRALETCVTADPRRDWQTESRSLYYARLFLELEADLDGLGNHLFDVADLTDHAEERTGLTLAVLGRLAEYGRRDALELLRRYAAHGSNLGWALDELALRDDDAGLSALGPQILARFPEGAAGDAELAEAVRGSYEQHPWRLWAKEHPRAAMALERVSVRQWDRQLRPRGPLPGWSVADILAWADHREPGGAAHGTEGGDALLPAGESPVRRAAAAARCLIPVARPEDRPLLLAAARDGRPGARCAALRHLAEHDDPEILGLIARAADDLDEQIAETALVCLRGRRGENALRQARRWARERDGGYDRLGLAAAEFLALRGVQADGPEIARALREILALHGADDPRLLPLLDGAGRLRAAECAPMLRQVYAETAGSATRGAAARALAATDATYAAGYAVECLWDCEEGTRELAARHAAIGDVRVLKRLRNLAVDPAEEDEVHEAARGRLTEPR